MMLRISIFLIVVSVLATSVYADDSIASRKSVFVIPHASYQQETSWSAGIAAAYYFKSSDLGQISAVTGSVTYTLNNQFIVNVTPRIYSKNKNWLFAGNLYLQKYPDFYFGTGGNTTILKVGYISRNFNLTLQPQYIVNKRIYIGGLLSYKASNVSVDSTDSFMEEQIYSVYGDAGWRGFNQLSLGIVAAFDSRDNQYFPERGLFMKSVLSFTPKWLVKSFPLADFQIDTRYFKSIVNGQVLALQGVVSGVLSGDEIPFQLMPTIGGADLFRGFRRGMYRQNFTALVQSEYRVSLYKRLKSVAFFTLGNVFDSHFAANSKLKIAYGAGLRYRLNDARVHLRFDIAKNNYGDKLQFYITATEAF